MHLYRNGNLDSVDIHVELDAGHQHLTQAEQQAVCNELSKQIKTYIGISTRVLLQPAFSLKRSEGKACHVFDKRG